VQRTAALAGGRGFVWTAAACALRYHADAG